MARLVEHDRQIEKLGKCRWVDHSDRGRCAICRAKAVGHAHPIAGGGGQHRRGEASRGRAGDSVARIAGVALVPLITERGSTTRRYA